MKNDATQSKKGSGSKVFAVTGFIGIIILIAWLSIKLVNFIPGAFSSLASLAEGIDQYEEQQSAEEADVQPLTVTSNVTLTVVGEPVNISWDKSDLPGNYTFEYECTDGVAVDVLNIDRLGSIACDTSYELGDASSLTISIDSEKERYADLKYKVSFEAADESVQLASGDASVTILNSEIQNVLGTEDREETGSAEESNKVYDVISGISDTIDNITGLSDSDTEIEEEAESETVETVEEEVEETEEPEETPEESEETVSTPETTTEPTEIEFVYTTMPVSDPNGRTDLAVNYFGSGTIVGNTFFPGFIEQGESGAIQFEVRNYGSKTSDDWTFNVSLPNGGTYESEVQEPLKPNERALLTIGFLTTNHSSHNFVVTVDEPSDQAALNDSFQQFVTFVE